MSRQTYNAMTTLCSMFAGKISASQNALHVRSYDRALDKGRWGRAHGDCESSLVLDRPHLLIFLNISCGPQ
jgi:hypothetical protein